MTPLLWICGHIDGEVCKSPAKTGRYGLARESGFTVARQPEGARVDDEFSMRKVTRALLQAIGVRNIYEASDGRSDLDAIRARA